MEKDMNGIISIFNELSDPKRMNGFDIILSRSRLSTLSWANYDTYHDFVTMRRTEGIMGHPIHYCEIHREYRYRNDEGTVESGAVIIINLRKFEGAHDYEVKCGWRYENENENSIKVIEPKAKYLDGHQSMFGTSVRTLEDAHEFFIDTINSFYNLEDHKKGV